MKIRKANKLDLKNILVINKIFDYWNPDTFIELSINLWQVYVCEIDDKIVWFLLYQILWWNTPFLSLIKIMNEYQWKWYWSKLLEELEIELNDIWYNSYICSTELVNNLSQKFITANNFKKIGALKMNHWEEFFYIKEISI